jgi:hypothetical protein
MQREEAHPSGCVDRIPMRVVPRFGDVVGNIVNSNDPRRALIPAFQATWTQHRTNAHVMIGNNPDAATISPVRYHFKNV